MGNLSQLDVVRLSRSHLFRPRQRLPLPEGLHVVTVGLELTEDGDKNLRLYAAAAFPRTPSGRVYLGKAATAVYNLGLRYISEELGAPPTYEDLYGTISAPEARDAGLRVIERIGRLGR